MHALSGKPYKTAQEIVFGQICNLRPGQKRSTPFLQRIVAVAAPSRCRTSWVPHRSVLSRPLAVCTVRHWSDLRAVHNVNSDTSLCCSCAWSRLVSRSLTDHSSEEGLRG